MNLSDAPYKKECTACKQQITMSKEIGNKWRPYNEDGSEHDCRQQKITNQEPTKLNHESKLARAVLLVQDALKLLESMKQ